MFFTPESPLSNPPPSASQAIPPQINEACGLVLGSLVLSILGSLADGYYATEPRPPMPEPPLLSLVWDLTMFFGTLMLIPWLVLCLRRRKLWARWAMLALLAYGWLQVAQDIPVEWPRSAWVALTEGMTTLMEFGAVWLLFFGAGGRWLAEADVPVDVDVGTP